MNVHPRGDRRVDHSNYEYQEHRIDGTTTVVYHAGNGSPLVYLHGAGTWHGLKFADDWPAHFSTYLPYHPGFGPSETNPRIDSFQGYVDHYVKLLDALELDRVNLIGFSLGALVAVKFAAQHGNRISKLVLAAPVGLNVPAHPQPDLMSIPPEEFPNYLANDIGTILPYLPSGPDEEFQAMRMKEGTSTARLLRNGSLIDPDLPYTLGLIQSETLLIWGREDRIVPCGQAEYWRKAIPQSQALLFSNAGHLVLDESLSARDAVLSFLLNP